MPKLPCEGIRVIDMSISWMGPRPCYLLGDLGAEVIRVESIQYPDPLRGPKRPAGPRVGSRYPNDIIGERPWDRSDFFSGITRNEYGITLDLTNPKGVELLKRLVKVADVVAESWSPKVKQRFGLTYEELKEIKPNIIMISSSAFGQTGPYANFMGWGPGIENMMGNSSLRAYPDGGPPMTAQSAWTDPIAGVVGCVAILTALHYRERTGKGQYIDLCQIEAISSHMGEVIMDYTLNKRVQNPIGNRHTSMAPHGSYRCAGDDKWAAIAVTSDDEWKRFCAAMGNPSWAQEERFADGLSRWKNQDELDQLITEWTIQHDQYAVMDILQRAGIAAAPVLNQAQLYDDPQLKERGYFVTVDHRAAGAQIVPGPRDSWTLSKTPATVRLPAPCLGEHNDYVLGGILGLSKEELSQLEQEKIIGTEPIEPQVL